MSDGNCPSLSAASVRRSGSIARRKAPRSPDDEVALTGDIIELARQYGRYGYSKIAALLRDAGWRSLQEAPLSGAEWSCRRRLVNDKRVDGSTGSP
jgi:transposase InsO family protein